MIEVHHGEYGVDNIDLCLRKAAPVERLLPTCDWLVAQTPPAMSALHFILQTPPGNSDLSALNLTHIVTWWVMTYLTHLTHIVTWWHTLSCGDKLDTHFHVMCEDILDTHYHLMTNWHTLSSEDTLDTHCQVVTHIVMWWHICHLMTHIVLSRDETHFMSL